MAFTLGMTAYVIGAIFGFCLILYLSYKSIKLIKTQGNTKKGVALLVGPLLIITFFVVVLFAMRNAYTTEKNDGGYVATGKMVYWHEKSVDGEWTSFVFKGTQYVYLYGNGAKGNLDIIENISVGAPFVNIQHRTTLWEDFFGFNDAQMIFILKNQSGYQLLTDGGNLAFCKEKDAVKIRAYYNNLGHYNFYLYNSADLYDEGDRTKAQKMTMVPQKVEAILNTDEKAQTFTLEHNPDERIIEYVSKDNVFTGSVDIVMIKDKYYKCKSGVDIEGSNATAYDCVPLSKELNDYLRGIL